MRLTNDHIDYITKDLTYRGIIAEEVQGELIDHICSAVEIEMKNGTRFIEAYHKVLHQFGHNAGLRQTQQQTIQTTYQKTSIMLSNYFIIAWRNLRKQSFYSLINIFGLAVGVAASLIIVLFIVDELRYDQYNTKADRLYRVEAGIKFGGNEFQMAYRPAPEAHALLENFPEVESVVRMRPSGSYLVKPADNVDNMKEQNVIWADSTFFKVFSVNVVEGNAKTALAEAGGVAISRRVAEKYFKGKSALGQSLILDNKYYTKVNAVYENIPSASHFHFDIIVSMIGDWPIAREAKSTSFMSENFLEYVVLTKGSNPKDLEKKFPAFIEKNMGPEVAQAFGPDFTFEKFRATGNKYDVTLRPVTDIHLHSNVRGELEPNGSITYIYLFTIIAGFILIIGCINFMNLSTARSSNRAKEVGVRKVMGSMRSHLIRQFLTESTLVALFAFCVAVFLAYLFLPLFNYLSQKQLQLPFGDPVFYLILTASCLLIGFIAGLYPSFFLSAFKPVNVLKGNVALGMKSGAVRSSLVVLQFVISIFLIVGAIAVNRQLNFIQNKKLGFEKDQVIVIHDTYALRPKNVEPFKNEVLRLGSVEAGTISGFVPVESDWSWRSNSTLWKTGSEPTAENMVSSQIWEVDYDYIETFKMKINEGRGFSKEFPGDSQAIVLNQTAAKRLGLSKDLIGKKLSTFIGVADPNHISNLTIIGIVDDFHFSSMKEYISSLGLILGKADGSVCFRFQPNQTQETIQSIEKIWKQLAPGQPFQYSFLDEDFAKMYDAEQRLGTVFSLFAGLAIIIACLGLFALTAFTAEQRTKEIGIRKVLGASVSSIVVLLSKEFGKLILIAFVFSTPIAWWCVSKWLEGYQYKVEIGWWIFVLAGFISLVIAWITMSFQSIKAALMNPVKSLRSE
ncbi:MAG TPA: ABC transporter permease [Cyclobacteriaceae bacterium]|nr:ABC transporter permease [Cyclobacteriaceae bacterium]